MVNGFRAVFNVVELNVELSPVELKTELPAVLPRWLDPLLLFEPSPLLNPLERVPFNPLPNPLFKLNPLKLLKPPSPPKLTEFNVFDPPFKDCKEVKPLKLVPCKGLSVLLNAELTPIVPKLELIEPRNILEVLRLFFCFARRF